jgi:hypothetical protein
MRLEVAASIRRAISDDVLLRQAVEHDDVVDAVEKLRPEGVAQLLHHGLPGALERCLPRLRSASLPSKPSRLPAEMM